MIVRMQGMDHGEEATQQSALKNETYRVVRYEPEREASRLINHS